MLEQGWLSIRMRNSVRQCATAANAAATDGGSTGTDDRHPATAGAAAMRVRYDPAMRNAFLRITLLLLAVYVFYAWQIWRVQRGMLFPGTALPRGELPADAQPVTLPASFGSVEVAFLPAPGTDARGPAAIYLHGNYETIADAAYEVAPLRALGLHVLLVEFPGYARTAGAPTFDSLREAGKLAYDWLVRDARVDASRILVVGRSIGGGPAAQLAVDRPARALLFLSSFVDLERFAHERLLPAFLIEDPFDNGARVREFDGEVLVMHGRRDDIIAFGHGEALAAQARNGEIVVLQCGHNDCDYWNEPQLVRVRAFLQRAGVL